MSKVDEISKKIMELYIDRGDGKDASIPPQDKDNSTGVLPLTIPSSLPTLSNKPMQMNTMIQWEVPIELCPSCIARLKGKEPQYLKGWTNNAKATWGKKKQVKAPKVAQESVAEEVEVI